ncbi:Gram-negative bacterial tonB protein [compost metagenome]
MPEVPQEKKYSAGIVSVSFEQAGITQATRTLPFFPDVGPQAAGEKTVVIDLDVSAQGKPQLVLISSSSGVALYDEAALAAAWTWQFAKQPVGHLQRVTVSFRR